MVDSATDKPRISPFIRHVRVAMVRTGMTQAKLAQLAETRQATISLILAGKQIPSLVMAEKIARALGLDGLLVSGPQEATE